MATAPTVGGAAPAAAQTGSEDVGLAGLPDATIRSAGADAAMFTGATYVAQVLTFITGLVQKGILGPIGAGYWALMQSFWVYLTIAPLGTMSGTGRQIPAHRGRGDLVAAAAVSNAGSSYSVAAIGAVGTALAVVALLVGDGWPEEIQYGLVLLGLTAPVRLFSDAHKSILQAVKRFDVSSLTAIVEAAILLTLQTLCVVLFGFYGMFAGIVLSILGLYLLWGRLGLVSWRRPAFRWRFDRSRVGELMSFGFPLMLQGQIWLLFMSVDNLIVAGFISVKDLGYYALAVSVTNYVLHLPRSIAAALFPRMTEQFVATNDIRSLRHYAVDTQRLLAYMLVPVFVGASYFLVPVMIRHGLPEFESAIPIVHIMVAASFLIALVNMPTKMLTTAGYRWGLVFLIFVCLLVNVVANYSAVALLDWGLEGAAGATAFSYLVAFLVLTVYALSKVFKPREVATHVAELLLVFAYVIGAVWGIELLVGSGAGPFVEDTLVACAKVGLFMVALTPWLIAVQVRYDGVARVLRFVPGVRKLVPSKTPAVPEIETEPAAEATLDRRLADSLTAGKGLRQGLVTGRLSESEAAQALELWGDGVGRAMTEAGAPELSLRFLDDSGPEPPAVEAPRGFDPEAFARLAVWIDRRLACLEEICAERGTNSEA